MANIIHAAERKAFRIALDRVVEKAKEGNAAEVADSLINMIQKILGDTWSDDAYARLHQIAGKIKRIEHIIMEYADLC